jgi:ABC-type molybdate transport system ATPase subunit
LNRSIGFLLNDDRTFPYTTCQRNVTYPERNQITATQLAVNDQIKQSQIPLVSADLNANPDGPDFLGL